MSGEALFKSIVSGENQSILGDIARSSLGFLSKGYEKAVSMRNAKFDEGKGVTKVTVPVISVGNITAGGTGKTPMVRFICDVLTQKGLHPTVLSRGYRAEDNKKNIIISKDGTMLVEPTISGDEAWLLAKVLQKSNVIIGRERSKSAEIAINELGADCLVMDDGFQHRALARDIDIVLIDASNPFGYDHVLPRGLLREPLSGLQRAHIIVLTKVDQVAPGIVSGIRKRLFHLVPNIPVYETTHKPQFMYPFGDHHDFTNDDVVDIWKEAFAHQADAICITEKDAVKLSQLHAIEDLKIPILVLSIGIEFISGKQEFIENLEI